jgi:hypothetical protein
MMLLNYIGSTSISSATESLLSQGIYLDQGHCLFRFVNAGYCNANFFSSPNYIDLGGALAAFGLIFTVYQLRKPSWELILRIRPWWQRHLFWIISGVGLALVLARVLMTQLPLGYLSYPFDVPLLYEIFSLKKKFALAR